jgi:hypothetical protein
MEVRFTPEQESRLAQLAGKEGSHAEHLVNGASIQLMGRASGPDDAAAGKARKTQGLEYCRFDVSQLAPRKRPERHRQRIPEGKHRPCGRLAQNNLH